VESKRGESVVSKRTSGEKAENPGEGLVGERCLAKKCLRWGDYKTSTVELWCRKGESGKKVVGGNVWGL